MPSKWIRPFRSVMNGLNNNIIPGECQLPSKGECMEVWRSSDAVCFDVDSTVITDEGLDQLAAFCGKGEEIKKMTLQAMQGRMEFRDALRMRLNILRPNLETVQRFVRTHPPKLTKDVGRLVSALHARDVDVYLVSGGFRSLIAPVAKMLNIPLENIFANRLKFFYDGEYGGFDEAQLTSRSGGKAEVISYLKKKEGYSRIVMIGDGATDMEACPPADGFIGFGGNVVRESVRNIATWYVTDFATLISELERKD
ncbi:phosphoserine phosphatase isoform X1 [Penaeus vannamei]|uniref:Phosphoserine phosphatase n=2 Tax=Penaeus vannamei TaxID=6689 RepID=A0A3R7LYM4_PENVA|nr:phosphoserine phosphatase-like [Penaeus vannamei]ROT68058.1 phosphoserine phosphatase [Penaeus vannamei]